MSDSGLLSCARERRSRIISVTMMSVAASDESSKPLRVEFEQIVADHDQPRMLLRLRQVIGHDVARRQAAGQRVHRRQPAMDLALHEVVAGVAERSRQRLQRGIDQFTIAQIGERQRIGAGDQEVEHAVLADVVTGTFIVDAAAAERLRRLGIFSPQNGSSNNSETRK